MSNYSKISKLLHKQFLNEDQLVNFFINRLKNKSKQTNLKSSNFIFITGLARSGTTALLQLIDETRECGSIRYKYMPFILYPKLAKIYSMFYSSSNFEEVERLHGDGFMMSPDSAECLDEPFWIFSIYKKSKIEKYLYPHRVDNEVIKSYSYLLDSYLGIEQKKRMIIKNNNLHLRLKSLSLNLPNSNFLILFRSPLAQAYSLLTLHKRLINIQKKDEFVLEYMNLIGHWEFGLGKKQFIYRKEQKIILDKLDDQKIEYWLTQWIFTYEWILKNVNKKKSKNIKLICYEKICNDKIYRERLFNYLEINKKVNNFVLKLGKSNNKALKLNCNEEKLSYAFKIYDELKDISYSNL